MVGAIKDEITYDFGYHILYRQHEYNEVGSVVYNSPIRKIKARLNKIKHPGKRHGRSVAASELVRCYPEYTRNDSFINALTSPRDIKNKIRLIKMYPLYRQHASQGKLSYVFYVVFDLI